MTLTGKEAQSKRLWIAATRAARMAHKAGDMELYRAYELMIRLADKRYRAARLFDLQAFGVYATGM